MISSFAQINLDRVEQRWQNKKYCNRLVCMNTHVHYNFARQNYNSILKYFTLSNMFLFKIVPIVEIYLKWIHVGSISCLLMSSGHKKTKYQQGQTYLVCTPTSIQMGQLHGYVQNWTCVGICDWCLRIKFEDSSTHATVHLDCVVPLNLFHFQSCPSLWWVLFLYNACSVMNAFTQTLLPHS